MKFSLKPFLNKSTQKMIEGDIGYFGLENWWLSNFTDEERKYIEDIYRPLGSSPNSPTLTKGHIDFTSMTATGLLSNLASWFNNPRDRYIAEKMLIKAQEVNKITPKSKRVKNVLDEHFTLSEMITVYYRQRDKQDMLKKTIEICLQQISLAPLAAKKFLSKYPDQPLPSHRGYEQLVIIFDKENKIHEAIHYCEQAKIQGWAGNWENRIKRYRKKLNKLDKITK